MKSFICILMTVALLISITACGEHTAEKYCVNCGGGMAKDAAFCQECGAAAGVVATTTTAEVTPTATDSSNNKSTETTKATKKSTKTTKKSAKPSTAKATTTTTKPTTTIHKHTYSNFVCTGCGNFDNEHLYEFLIAFVKENGETSGTRTELDVYGNGETYLVYSAQYDELSVEYTRVDSYGNHWFSALYLDTFFWGTTMTDLETLDKIAEVQGYLTVSSFTENSPISYSEYMGDDDFQESFIEASRTSIVYLVAVLDDVITQIDIGATVADLGFLSWDQ